jgi:hypothetical protein
MVVKAADFTVVVAVKRRGPEKTRLSSSEDVVDLAGQGYGLFRR